MVRMVGNPDCVPGEIGRHQRGLPVIGVNQVGCPVLVQSACRQLGSGRGKSPEAHVVVRPVPAGGVAIGIAGAVVELRAQQDIDRQAVLGRRQPERAGRHFRQRRALADDLDMRELFDDVPVARQQNPDVAPARASARGRAAETAARPPTRTKSSISVVTNKYPQEMPSYRALTETMQEQFQFLLHCEMKIVRIRESAVSAAGAPRIASRRWRRNLGSRRGHGYDRSKGVPE